MIRENISAAVILTAALVLSGCTYIDKQVFGPANPNHAAPPPERPAPVVVVVRSGPEFPETAAQAFLTGERMPATEAVTVAATANAGAEECAVLATALQTIANDWRTNPHKRTLTVDTYAVSAEHIDAGYLARVSGLVPPKSLPAIDVDNCGTTLAPSADLVDFVWPHHGLPSVDGKVCWRTDGGWISRPGIDAGHTHAVVLYAEQACGGNAWLVRMTKDYRGIWNTDPPDPLYVSSWNSGALH